MGEPGNNPGGPNGSGGPGGPHPGGSNSESFSQTSGDQNLPGLNNYDPSGTIPPRTNHDLFCLIKHRLEQKTALHGCGTHRVSALFGHDNMINNIAKQMLFAHIYDHREDLPTAYIQLDAASGNLKWACVSISLTSPILRSLANS